MDNKNNKTKNFAKNPAGLPEFIFANDTEKVKLFTKYVVSLIDNDTKESKKKLTRIFINLISLLYKNDKFKRNFFARMKDFFDDGKETEIHTQYIEGHYKYLKNEKGKLVSTIKEKGEILEQFEVDDIKLYNKILHRFFLKKFRESTDLDNFYSMCLIGRALTKNEDLDDFFSKIF